MTDYRALTPRASDTPDAAARKRRIAGRLLALRAALRQHLGQHSGEPDRTADPSPRAQNLRIATWNIREFDAASYGARVDEAFHYIAEIISHFDLIAVQEVREDLAPVDRLRRLLGAGWDYIATDVSSGARGNAERMVFLFNTAKVWFRGVAGELTLSESERLMLPNSFDLIPAGGVEIELPPGATLDDPGPQGVETTRLGTKLKKEVAISLPPGTKVTLPETAQLVFGGYAEDLAPDGRLALGAGSARRFGAGAGVRLPTDEMRTEDLQFARTPFFALFQSAWLKIALCTVHIYYGDDDADGLKMARRRAEIEAITRCLAARAREMRNSDADSWFIVLGDFNIVGREHGTMQALERNGFIVPDEIRQIPAGSNVRRDKFYDQIAIWRGEPGRAQRFRSYTDVEIRGADVFDFFRHVFRHGDDDPEGEDAAHYARVMADEVAHGRARQIYNYPAWRTYQMSDHLPMWVELNTDFADRYLDLLARAP